MRHALAGPTLLLIPTATSLRAQGERQPVAGGEFGSVRDTDEFARSNSDLHAHTGEVRFRHVADGTGTVTFTARPGGLTTE